MTLLKQEVADVEAAGTAFGWEKITTLRIRGKNC
jgi:hypothetical protein